jgi:hypothetical protein
MEKGMDVEVYEMHQNYFIQCSTWINSIVMTRQSFDDHQTWFLTLFRDPVSHLISRFRWEMRSIRHIQKRFKILGNARYCQSDLTSSTIALLRSYPCHFMNMQTSELSSNEDNFYRPNAELAVEFMHINLLERLDFALISGRFEQDIPMFFCYAIGYCTLRKPKVSPTNVNDQKNRSALWYHSPSKRLHTCPFLVHAAHLRSLHDHNIYFTLHSIAYQIHKDSLKQKSQA